MFHLLYLIQAVFSASTSVKDIIVPSQLTKWTTRIPDKMLVTLDENNHFLLRGQVNDKSIDELLVKFYKKKFKAGDAVLFYILSPGGSIMAGNRVIRLFHSLEEQDVTVHCIADHAASMAFAILQSCSYRYVVPGSVLHQHQASMEVQGTLKKIENSLAFAKEMTEKSNKLSAERMNMSVSEFQYNFVEDRYIYEENAIKVGAADGLIHIHCSPSLTKKSSSTYVMTIFGLVKLTYSKCPLIHSPLSVSLEWQSTDGMNTTNSLKWSKLFGNNYPYNRNGFELNA